MTTIITKLVLVVTATTKCAPVSQQEHVVYRDIMNSEYNNSCIASVAFTTEKLGRYRQGEKIETGTVTFFTQLRMFVD